MRNELTLAALFLICLSCVTATSYYVSPAGNDNNPGTQAQPFRTIAKSISMLHAGDQLLISGGTYNEQFRMTSSNSGTMQNPIIIMPVAGLKAIVDGQNSSQNEMIIDASYVNVSGLEVRNSGGMCIIETGSYVNFDNLEVHNCYDQGVQFSGNHSSIKNSKVYLADLMNQPRAISGGWPSGIKVREGQYIDIIGNTVYDNYGEGLGIRGKHVNIRNNIVFDCYSLDIYVDNSFDVTVDSNFAYSTGNSEFFRNNNPATCYGAAEEYYSGWGSNLGQVNFINNIGFNCNLGFDYGGHESGVTQPGYKGGLIANNIFWGSIDRAIRFVDEANTHDVFVYNNIVEQGQGKLADFKGTTGLTIDYNFWVGTPSVLNNARGQNDKTGDVKMTQTQSFSPDSFMLKPDSPAIDAGKTLLNVPDDYLGVPRPKGAGYDMGAYEFTNGQVQIPPQRKNEDTNNDGIIDLNDIKEILRDFGKANSFLNNLNDVNKDGKVNVLDIILVAKSFGK